jgi:Spy/CpxP family protein refolding chaperone
MAMRLIGGALLLVATLAAQGAPQTKWWESPQTKARLGLTDDQARNIEQIYNGTLPERRRNTENAARLAAELEALLLRPDSTEQSVMELAERAAAAEALRSRARIIMLYRMYRVLTPVQRRQLEQMTPPHRRDGSSRPPGIAKR